MAQVHRELAVALHGLHLEVLLLDDGLLGHGGLLDQLEADLVGGLLHQRDLDGGLGEHLLGALLVAGPGEQLGLLGGVLEGHFGGQLRQVVHAGGGLEGLHHRRLGGVLGGRGHLGLGGIGLGHVDVVRGLLVGHFGGFLT